MLGTHQLSQLQGPMILLTAVLQLQVPARSLSEINHYRHFKCFFFFNTQPQYLPDTPPLPMPICVFCSPSSINTKSCIVSSIHELFSAIIALSNTVAPITFLRSTTSVGKLTLYTLSHFSVYTQEHCRRKP